MALEKLLASIEPGSPEEALAKRINPARLPSHIAIIMDGNGRWAAQRHLPRVQGHQAGCRCRARHRRDRRPGSASSVLTLYAFSAENWKRPQFEVMTLMRLLKRYLRLELQTLITNDIRFQVIGRLDGLGRDVQQELARAHEATASCRGMLFNIALNYGGRAEIVDAARRAIEIGTGRLQPRRTDASRDLLYTAGQPDPDLLIRTSGELRVSNFLLWQIAYAEIHVTDVLWPDFRCRHLLEAVLDYQTRDRRFGGLKPLAQGRGGK